MTETLTDLQGTEFDPEKHEVDDTGAPVLNKNKTFKKKKAPTAEAKPKVNLTDDSPMTVKEFFEWRGAEVAEKDNTLTITKGDVSFAIDKNATVEFIGMTASGFGFNIDGIEKTRK